MTLEEQLAMATNTVTESTQPVTTAEVQTQTVVNEAQIQSEAQVVQPTQTAIQGVQTIQLGQQPMPTMATQGYTAPNISQPSVMNGVQTIQLGQQVNLNKLNLTRKMSTGDKMRFTVLNTTDFAFIKFHYSETMGKFACFTPNDPNAQDKQCCLDLGKPKHRYTMPVLVYPTMPNNPRTIIPNTPAELRVLAIWDDASYDYICNELIAAGGQPIDFIATCTDTFGRLNIMRDTTSYAQNFANDFSAATQIWNAHKDMMPVLIRKNMDEATYINQKNQVMAQAAQPATNYSGSYNNMFM